MLEKKKEKGIKIMELVERRTQMTTTGDCFL